MTNRTPHPLIFVLGAALFVAGCTVKDDSAPPLLGPSGLGTSIDLEATPDAIFQDGASQSRIKVTARGPNGQLLRDQVLHAAISVNGTIVDFGRLSAKNVVTGGDGAASVTYTAPAPVPGAPVDSNTVVAILVTPSGTDFANASARSVNIRLLPTGTVLPPTTAPTANFTMSPATASAKVNIQFDGSSSTDDGQIVNYAWTFGDGGSASGVVVNRSYAAAGTYTVTLRVTDDRGLTGTTSRQITIGTSTNPVAAFTVSPASPRVGQTAFFNAALSQASPGRTITGYEWSFGDGSTASGISPTHIFATAGSFAVTLTVTDDLGNRGVSSQTISTGTVLGPTAELTVSPSQAVINSPVQANGSTSKAQPGQPIVRYDFNFGDGSPITSGTNPVATHTYRTTGSYKITLTVTDAAGRSDTKDFDITIIGNQSPVPVFVYSPQSPVNVGQTVTFDASASQAPQNATITRYEWMFDGSGIVYTSASPLFQFTYSVAGTYDVRLRVFDNQGGEAITVRLITVQ